VEGEKDRERGRLENDGLHNNMEEVSGGGIGTKDEIEGKNGTKSCF